MLREIKVLATVMAIGLVAGACGGTAAPSAAPATSAASAAATQAQGQLPKPELTKIRIGISAPTEPVQFAEKLADQLGYYKEFGITDVTVIGFEGDGKALQAVVAGQLDMFVGGSSTAINSVVTDTPMKVVSMNSVLMTDGMYCQKDIKTKEDAKGKALAISTFGGTSHGSALLALQAMGFTSKDMVIKEVGNEGTRIAALRGGSVSCGMVGIQSDAAMKAAGLNLIVDLAKSKVQWGRSGLMVPVSFLQKNPNTVLVVIAATLRAQNQFWTDPATVTTKFIEWSQAKPDDAKSAVTQFPDYGDRAMTFTDEAFKAPKEVLATVNPAVANVDTTKAWDLSFLNKLKDIGFYAKYNIPTQ